MRLSRFFAAVTSIALIAFPYNIIGCADTGNPYDFFTSFFDPRLGSRHDLKPFYYTYDFLYDQEEPVDQWAVTSRDWLQYAAVDASEKEARDLTGNYTHDQLYLLHKQAESGSVAKLPDSVTRNRLVQQLLKNKDLEAFKYLMYLRDIQPFVDRPQYAWEVPPRDSLAMESMTGTGKGLYNAAAKPFFKQRLAYQVQRLSLYNYMPDQALLWYDKVMANDNSANIRELSEALRAGALYQRGDRAQAAYQFCQLFAKGKMKKVANYLSYHVYLKDIPTAMMLGYCKTEKEKANVLATIAMGNPALDLRTLERISRLSPGDPLLDMLAVREINKLEEKYLSPRIPAGSQYFDYNYYYNDEQVRDTVTEKQVQETAGWMQWMADNKETKNPGLYATGAAYLHYMLRDYPKAREWISAAKGRGVKGEVEDQLQLTELLVTINEQDRIDAAFEEKILPSLQWLEKKANADKTGNDYYSDGPWTRFYRNLFSSVIVPKYNQQGDAHKAVLGSGTAESINAYPGNTSYYALSEARKKLRASDAIRLEKLINDKDANAFEKYLVARSTIKANDVRDLIGTTYLREDKLEEAIQWFSKVEQKYYRSEPFSVYLDANPFADLLLDTHSKTKQDTVRYNKLGFTKKMLAMRTQYNQATDPNKKAKLAYEMAKGYYHMTYWGNSWLLVAYDWSGSDYGWATAQQLATEKNYYEAARAKQWYQKAFDLSSDKEFKARALFMVAKCVQKEGRPVYERYKDWDKFDKAREEYLLRAVRNPVFPKLKKDYSTTKFYRQAMNTCSYLKDFNSGKTKMPGY